MNRIKNECRQQIFDGEIESYKLRLNQMNKEKDGFIKTLKESEKKYKELQMKHDANELAWNRLKSEMSEKQRKVKSMKIFDRIQKENFAFQYDESIKLKSELQNAVDRLRQKLHDLELHSQDKQNKYSVDKQQWEMERVELIGKINEVRS